MDFLEKLFWFGINLMALQLCVASSAPRRGTPSPQAPVETVAEAPPKLVETIINPDDLAGLPLSVPTAEDEATFAREPPITNVYVDQSTPIEWPLKIHLYLPDGRELIIDISESGTVNYRKVAKP